METFSKLTALAFCILATPAAAVTITGYNIQDARRNNWFGWAHTYDGNIGAPTTTDATYLPLTQNYTGQGSGTMNNGVVETSAQNTHIFFHIAGRTDVQIELFFDQSYYLSELEIYGGDFNNGVTGNFDRLTVTAGGLSAQIATTDFGWTKPDGNQVNDRADLLGAGLSGTAVSSIILSGWGYKHYDSAGFSIAEIVVSGSTTPISAVPLPATGVLLFASLAGIGAMRRKKKTG